MLFFHYIIWQPNPIAFHIGSFPIKWYGMLYALTFCLVTAIGSFIYKKEGKPVEEAERFAAYMWLSMIISARLGYALFYNAHHYLWHPYEIFLPIRFDPYLKFTGFSGFASHGGIMGVLIGIYLYVNYRIHISIFPPRLSWQKQQPIESYVWLATPSSLTFALCAAVVRLGNAMNSEIPGKPTHQPWGFVHATNIIKSVQDMNQHINCIDKIQLTPKQGAPLVEQMYQPVILEIVFKKLIDNPVWIEENFFKRLFKTHLVHHPELAPYIKAPADKELQYHLYKDQKGRYTATIQLLAVPRHPEILYEGIAYVILFLCTFAWWYKKHSSLLPGLIPGTILTGGMVARFTLEFFKEGVYLPHITMFSIEQLLCIPLFLAGLGFFIYAKKQANKRKLIKA